MMKRLLLSPLIITSPFNPVLAGIPESKLGKWVQIPSNSSIFIDTEDFRIQRNKIRFFLFKESPLGKS